MAVITLQRRNALSDSRQSAGCTVFDRSLDIVILCLYCSYQFFSKGDMTETGDLVSILAMLLILFKIGLIVYENTSSHILNEFNARAVIPILVLCALYYLGQNRFDLFVSYGLCIAICDLSAQTISDYVGLIFAIFYGSHLALYQLGFIQEFTADMPRLTDQGMTYRLALGFDQPNFNTCFILPILSAAVVSRKRWKRYAFLFVAMGYTLGTYRYTNARTGLIAVLCGVFLWAISESIGKYVKRFWPIIVWAIIACISATYFVSNKYYGNEKVNFLLSQRPAIMKNIQGNGLGLFFNSNLKAAYFTGDSIDNFYFMLIYGYGLLVAIPVFYLLVNLSKVAELHDNRQLPIVIMIYLIYGLTENHVLDFGFSYLALFLFLPFVRQSSFDVQIEESSYSVESRGV